MRIALLSCGQSLNPYKGDAQFAIGVNRAVERFKCDLWCFGDWQTFGMFRPLGKPGVTTSADSLFGLYKKFPEAKRLPAVVWSELDGPERRLCNWPCFSATAALVVAANLRATRIDCFGCDMVGRADFDGVVPASVNRDEDRWRRERVIWQQVADWLNGRGIELVRHGLTG
jgi:hypothetical protein